MASFSGLTRAIKKDAPGIRSRENALKASLQVVYSSFGSSVVNKEPDPDSFKKQFSRT